MESSDQQIIHSSVDKLVKVLKKRYRIYRRVIRKGMPSYKRVAYVALKSCDELDKRLRDIAGGEGSTPTKKRPLSANAPEFDLRQINEQNDVLDFDEDDILVDLFKTKPVNQPKESSDMKRSEAGNSKSKSTKNVANNQNNNQRPTIDMSSLSNSLQSSTFKIPKRASNEKDVNQSVRSVINMVKNMNINNANRCVDAFEQLLRYVNDAQWLNNDVLKTLAKIGIGLAANVENSGHVHKLESVIIKLKMGGYVDNDFWDELISLVVKRKTGGKCVHQLNSFLAHIYDFILQRNIRIRYINSEALIIAYRSFSTR